MDAGRIRVWEMGQRTYIVRLVQVEELGDGSGCGGEEFFGVYLEKQRVVVVKLYDEYKRALWLIQLEYGS